MAENIGISRFVFLTKIELLVHPKYSLGVIPMSLGEKKLTRSSRLKGGGVGTFDTQGIVGIQNAGLAQLRFQ